MLIAAAVRFTKCTVITSTPNPSAKMAIEFNTKKTEYDFSPRCKFVPNYAPQFMILELQQTVEHFGAGWNAALSYASMFSEKAKRMTDTLRQSIVRITAPKISHEIKHSRIQYTSVEINGVHQSLHYFDVYTVIQLVLFPLKLEPAVPC